MDTDVIMMLTALMMAMAVTAILLAGEFEVGNGTGTPGTVMAALTYTTQLLNGILMLVMLFQNISKGIASWKRAECAFPYRLDDT